MITKKIWDSYKKDHPSICATCYFYQQSKNEDNIGYCYGVPPTIEGKSIKVRSERRACSIHQNITYDMQFLARWTNEDFSIVYELLVLMILSPPQTAEIKNG